MFYRQLAQDLSSAQLPPREEVRLRTEQQNQEFVNSSAEFFPEYSDLRCTQDGTLWLRLFDPTVGRLGQGSDWLRLSEDGSHRLIALPEMFRTFRVERDRIWGTVRDALDVESVAWIALDSVR
jgi:hypothetical protein